MKTFTFVVAPCVPSMNPQSTFMVILTTVLLRFICHLFLLVAKHVLNFPLCLRPLPCTPSSSLAQRAPAFLLTFPFVDPPACFSMFPRSFLLVKTLGSLPYVLPRFFDLKNNCFIYWCLRYSFSHLLIFVFLLMPFVSICFTLLLILHCSWDHPWASNSTPVCPRCFSTRSGP